MCDRAHYDELESRVTALESEVNELRGETRTGFNSVNSNIETLSQQITNMDKRIIEEKVKWGEVTRSMVKWTVRVILAVVAYAAGINITRQIIPALFNLFIAVVLFHVILCPLLVPETPHFLLYAFCL